jgi:hypothetical protein
LNGEADRGDNEDQAAATSFAVSPARDARMHPRRDSPDRKGWSLVRGHLADGRVIARMLEASGQIACAIEIGGHKGLE